jgi:LysM repeat protein
VPTWEFELQNTSAPRRPALANRSVSLWLAVVIAFATWFSFPLLAGADGGLATWYGPGFQGHTMANGQVYDMYDPTTTACNIYPFGTWIRVANPANGRAVTVQVRDRGGFHHAFDLSYAAFRLIGDPAVMQIPVTYQVVSGPNADPAPARATTSSRGGRPAPQTQYVVQTGDSLGGIATQFGVDESALASWNGISDPNLIAVGDTLRLSPPPAPAPPPAPTATTGRTYVVRAGDTIYGIAAQFGVGADRLVTHNRLSDPADIQIGQTLTMPAAGSSATPQTYIVQDGDTLSGIAEKFAVTVGAMLFVNQLDDPDHIPRGLSLSIPGS